MWIKIRWAQRQREVYKGKAQLALEERFVLSFVSFLRFCVPLCRSCNASLSAGKLLAGQPFRKGGGGGVLFVPFRPQLDVAVCPAVEWPLNVTGAVDAHLLFMRRL